MRGGGGGGGGGLAESMRSLLSSPFMNDHGSSDIKLIQAHLPV